MSIVSEAWQFIKINFKWLLIAFVALFIFVKKCTPDTVPPKIETRTEQVPQPIVIMPPYQPQQSGPTVYPINIPANYQGVIPASSLEGLIAQVKDLSTKLEQLAREYYAVRNYDDSIQLKDTAGTRVGVVNLKQKVTENALKETTPSYQLSFPHTITTITQQAPARNQVYVGITVESLVGQLNSLGNLSIGGGILIKNKRDVVIGVTGLYNLKQKSPGVQLSLYKKLTFKL